MLGSKSVLQQGYCSNHCVGKQLSVMVLAEKSWTTAFQRHLLLWASLYWLVSEVTIQRVAV